MTLPLLEDLDSLPTLPAIVSQVFSQMNNPRSSIKEIAGTILKDQAISSKILQLVNSAFYGFPKRIGTISHGISILGFETVRGLILGISVIDTFRIKEFDLIHFWEHSVRTAVISSFISKKMRYPRVDEAFTIGLIHDIGKLVLMLKYPEAYKAVLKEQENYVEPFRAVLEIERKHLEIDHAYAGAQLARLWNFPLPYIEGIAQHHRLDTDLNSLGCIVYLGNLVANYHEIVSKQDEEDEVKVNYHLESTLNRFNIDYVEITKIITDSKQEIDEFLSIIYP